MAKFTISEKIETVHKYMDEPHGAKTKAKQIGVTHRILLYWVKLYKIHGDQAFVKRYTGYSVTFKLDVLNYMNENGTSLNETGAIFNIPSPGRLRVWLKAYETGGLDALLTKKKGRLSMKEESQNKEKKTIPAKGSVGELQEEIYRLRMENAYLKKLNALVHEKECYKTRKSKSDIRTKE